jgi:hypothetical protein
MTDIPHDNQGFDATASGARSEAICFFRIWKRDGGSVEAMRLLIAPGPDSNIFVREYRLRVLHFFDEFASAGQVTKLKPKPDRVVKKRGPRRTPEQRARDEQERKPGRPHNQKLNPQELRAMVAAGKSITEILEACPCAGVSTIYKACQRWEIPVPRRAGAGAA